jgi:hypothetical protein
MRYVVFVIDNQDELASGDEMSAIDAFNDMLQAKRYFITAAGIEHGGKAKVFDNRADAGLTSEGSLCDDAEHYSGFWLLDVPNREEAEHLAALASKACNRKVELRAYLR